MSNDLAKVYRQYKFSKPLVLRARNSDDVEDQGEETTSLEIKDPVDAAVNMLVKQSTPDQPALYNPPEEEKEQEDLFNFEDVNDMSYILDSQLWAESLYKPEAVSPVGAQGIAQFMPKTWEEVIQRGWVEEGSSPFDVDSSLVAQKEYMHHLYARPYVQSGETGTEKLKRTLAAYNWGIGNLSKAINKAVDETGNANAWFTYAPTETKNYVKKILNRANLRRTAGKFNHYSWD